LGIQLQAIVAATAGCPLALMLMQTRMFRSSPGWLEAPVQRIKLGYTQSAEVLKLFFVPSQARIGQHRLGPSR
jgi:hypothetical protein